MKLEIAVNCHFIVFGPASSATVGRPISFSFCWSRYEEKPSLFFTRKLSKHFCLTLEESCPSLFFFDYFSFLFFSPASARLTIQTKIGSKQDQKRTNRRPSRLLFVNGHIHDRSLFILRVVPRERSEKNRKAKMLPMCVCVRKITSGLSMFLFSTKKTKTKEIRVSNDLFVGERKNVRRNKVILQIYIID